MDCDGFEEILFGCPSSQDSVGDDMWDYDSQDEEMLYAPSDDQLTSWNFLNSPMLSPPLIDPPCNELVLDDGKDARIDATQFHHQDEISQTGRDRNWIIARIEGLIEGIVDGLLEDTEQLSITLRSRNGITRRKAQVDATGSLMPAKSREITFPGSTVQEAWRFTVLIRILELVHACLVDDTMMTKRDIYYRHPELFLKQSVVDRYVDDLACTLGVSRLALKVTAAAKGLVAGNFTILRDDSTKVNGLNEQEGMLVPNIHVNDVLHLSFLSWILVIEKEATFRSVLCSPQWKTLGPRGLVLTAKGYPDLASRKFLARFADHSPHVPIFCLVDWDPDGIAIMSTYKYGSYRLAHENVTFKGTPALNLPQLRWLGIQSHQISRTPVTEGNTDDDTIADAQGLMRLTRRDRTKARQMLEWDLYAENGPEASCRRELQTMLLLNIKAEMQILDELPGGMATWLSTELGARQGSGVNAEGPVSPVADTNSDDELLL